MLVFITKSNSQRVEQPAVKSLVERLCDGWQYTVTVPKSLQLPRLRIARLSLRSTELH